MVRFNEVNSFNKAIEGKTNINTLIFNLIEKNDKPNIKRCYQIQMVIIVSMKYSTMVDLQLLVQEIWVQSKARTDILLNLN